MKQSESYTNSEEFNAREKLAVLLGAINYFDVKANDFGLFQQYDIFLLERVRHDPKS